ncbi:MAG: Gfo/Idh/MocA family oxidoreductase [Candidatus Hydrogenedentes bacterium]|nr:Gfo/Idh/MocA family oxidoreductase [Candidatus Hydrogenedentota bacterium]
MAINKRPVDLSRRRFLQSSTAAAASIAFPYVIPGSALGLDGTTAPSNRITMGFIGLGKQAKGHLSTFRNDDRIQVLGICDVERIRRERHALETNEHYALKLNQPGYTCVDHYNDFRELCARDDIDTMVITTPDHWHAIPAIEAAKNGKDIYLEKPMSRTIEEGQAIVKAVRRYGRILQVGSMQRSDTAFHHACELVRNGRIGKVHTVNVNVGGPPNECYLPEQPVPEGLDWDFWLGPCPYRPYHHDLAPPEAWEGWPEWRYYRDYAGGGMCDFGAHHYDIAQWGLGMDHTGPVDVIPPNGADVDRLTYIYANGIKMYRGGAGGSGRGAAVEWIGTDGIVRVNRSQYLETEPVAIKEEIIGPNETRLYWSPNHAENWIEAVITRKEPICPPEVGHHTANICNIGNIAYWLNRPLKWDPDTETFVNDPEANRLIGRPMRGSWKLA